MEFKNKNQARLRLATVDGTRLDAPRRYAQSTSERSSSQGTLPPELRSMRIASASRHLREPYATFFKCPTVVSQSAAKASTSDSVGNDFKYDFRSMTDYHQTVIGSQPPFGEFTKWLPTPHNKEMEKNEVLAKRALRKLNLQRFLTREKMSQSELARRYADYRSVHEPDAKPIKGSFFSDLFRDPKKSFGEKLAFGLEKAVGLKEGELSSKDSLLEMEEVPPSREDEVFQFLQSMPPKKRAELLERLSRTYKHRRNA